MAWLQVIGRRVAMVSLRRLVEKLETAGGAGTSSHCMQRLRSSSDTILSNQEIILRGIVRVNADDCIEDQEWRTRWPPQCKVLRQYEM